MRVVLVVICLAACGRVHFDHAADASAAVPDAPPPMVCSTIGFTCNSGGNMRCDGACFVYCNEPTMQAEANDRCAAWSGGLASIASTAEQSCIDGLFTNDAWIALVQDSGELQPDLGWRWNDGTVAAITGWATAEPDDGDGVEDGSEQCAIQSSVGWLDVRCDSAKPFICKRPSL